MMPPGEVSKSFAGLAELSGAAAGYWKWTASGLIVALGGGVIGDLTGFAAGMLKRGVAFAQIPTTLARPGGFLGGRQDRDQRAARQEPDRDCSISRAS